jgi:superfamily II DNA or RNA helicase
MLIIKKSKSKTKKEQKTSKKKTKQTPNNDANDAIKDRETAEDCVKYMDIHVTGARQGELIAGIHNISKNSILRIHKDSPIIPPIEHYLDLIEAHKDLWTAFLQKLSFIEFFKNKSTVERAKWLRDNQTDRRRFDLGDVEKDGTIDGTRAGGGVIVEIVEAGALEIQRKGVAGLTDDDINYILSQEYVNTREVRNRYPQKTGSNAKYPTLFFLPKFWKITTLFESVTKFTGFSIDLVTGEFRNGLKVNSTDSGKELIHVFKNCYGKEHDQSIAFKLNRKYTGIGNKGFQLSEITGIDPKQYKLVKTFTSFFTTAGYKSLLQKTIRNRAKTAKLPNGATIETGKFLRIVCLLLIETAGSFVPDIQRYVTGLESFCKRIIVTNFEDSYFEIDGDQGKKDTKQIVRLIGAAYYAQKMRNWKPNASVVNDWLDYAVRLYEHTSYFKWNISRGHKLKKYIPTFDNKSKLQLGQLEGVSFMIDILRSFESDLDMMRDIATNHGICKQTNGKTFQPEYMTLEHCIDQHWAPDLVYFMDHKLIQRIDNKREKLRDAEQLSGKSKSLKDKLKEVKSDTSCIIDLGSKPFCTLFRKYVFKYVTGFNARKNTYVTEEDNVKMAQMIKKTQKIYWITKLKYNDCSKERLNGLMRGKKLLFEGQLNDQWLAALVGQIQINKPVTSYVTINTRILDEFIAVKKPSRDVASKPLTDKQYDSIVKNVTELLDKNGLPLKGCPNPSGKGILTGKKLYLKNNEYYINDMKWSDFAKYSFKIPVIKSESIVTRDDMSIDKMIKSSNCTGIMVNYTELTRKLVSETDNRIVRRALSYLSGFDNIIEMNKIGRDGGGTVHTVKFADIGAYQFLLRLSYIAPSALKLVSKHSIRFISEIRPLLWEIRQVIMETVSGKTQLYGIGKDKQIGWHGNHNDSEKRKLWDHQKESVNEMIKNGLSGTNGNKGHFIHIKVGLGKTLILIKYIIDLISKGQMPRYLLYTLPPTAVTAISDFEDHGFIVNRILPIKMNKVDDKYYKSSTKDCKLKPFVINVINHDHLRLCSETLVDMMHETFFIVDEVHLALSDTIRTSVALELARLSHDFIALTGTPVINTKIYNLKWWLSQIVPFQVTENNFWVAANSMIAKKIQTDITPLHHEEVVNMSIDEEKQYSKYVSSVLGGSNQNPTAYDIQKAINICYDIVTKGMVDKIKDLLETNKKVMVVCKDKKHQKEVCDKLQTKVTKWNGAGVYKMETTLFFTDETVKTKKTPDYDVVVVTLKQSTGYTLTRLNCMITGVYPSNNANREQLEGRINRIGQKEKELHYYTLHTGILTYIYQKHKLSKSMASAINELANFV